GLEHGGAGIAVEVSVLRVDDHRNAEASRPVYEHRDHRGRKRALVIVLEEENVAVFQRLEPQPRHLLEAVVSEVAVDLLIDAADLLTSGDDARLRSGRAIGQGTHAGTIDAPH